MPEVQVFSKVLLKRFCLTQKAGRNSRKLQPYFDHKDSSWKWSRESANLHHFAKKKHSLSEIILPNYVHFFIICGQIMFTSSLFVAKSLFVKSSFLTNLVPTNFEDFPPNKWITPKYFSHFQGHLEGVPQLKQSDSHHGYFHHWNKSWEPILQVVPRKWVPSFIWAIFQSIKFLPKNLADPPFFLDRRSRIFTHYHLGMTNRGVGCYAYRFHDPCKM